MAKRDTTRLVLGRCIRPNPAPCAVTRKTDVTDRAKRYRANQKGCLPAGPKVCELCESTKQMMVDHKDGNESNGARSNLRWLCRSCNTRLGALAAKLGIGRRTVQYNPKARSGAPNLAAYLTAIMVLKGESTAMDFSAARQLIHDTPKSRRSEFASEIWDKRERGGTARRSEVPF